MAKLTAAQKAAAKSAAPTSTPPTATSSSGPLVETATQPGPTENAATTPSAAAKPVAPAAKSDEPEAPKIKGKLVEIKQSMQGPHYGYNPGELVDWPDVAEADRLIAAEYVIAIKNTYGRPVRTHVIPKAEPVKPSKK